MSYDATKGQWRQPQLQQSRPARYAAVNTKAPVAGSMYPSSPRSIALRCAFMIEA